MSKTCLKFLPAEGEIKRGDYNLQTDYSTRSSGKPVVGIWDGNEPPVDNQFMKFQKVERYAVTSEFTEGDEVQTIDGDKVIVAEVKTAKTFYGEDASKYNSEVFFKILAPLSPHVSWGISDGQEIEGRIWWLDTEAEPEGNHIRLGFNTDRIRVYSLGRTKQSVCAECSQVSHN